MGMQEIWLEKKRKTFFTLQWFLVISRFDKVGPSLPIKRITLSSSCLHGLDISRDECIDDVELFIDLIWKLWRRVWVGLGCMDL